MGINDLKKLYGLTQHLFDLVKLSDIEKLPKTLMLSEKKDKENLH